MTLIYLAARYTRREELLAYAGDLGVRGHNVTSRWLLGNHQVSDDGLRDDANAADRLRFATEDWEDLQRAETVVAFTESPRSEFSRGGRHVELGAALAWGKRVIVVGPAENVFCCLPQVVRVDTWPEALALVWSARTDIAAF